MILMFENDVEALVRLREEFGVSLGILDIANSVDPSTQAIIEHQAERAKIAVNRRKTIRGRVVSDPYC